MEAIAPTPEKPEVIRTDSSEGAPPKKEYGKPQVQSDRIPEISNDIGACYAGRYPCSL